MTGDLRRSCRGDVETPVSGFATFTDATGKPTPRPELAGQPFSYGWNSDFGTAVGSPDSIHLATGTLTGTVNADGTGYTAQATYPAAS